MVGVQYMIEKPFITRYKRWLKPFWEHPDCAYQTDQGWDQFSDDEMATFRNTPGVWSVTRSVPGLRWPVTKKKSAFSPRFAEFGSHFNPDDDFRIYLMNKSSNDGLILLLLDIDDKQGTGHIDRAVRHLIDSYGLKSAYVEPSRGDHGRHVYVLLDMRQQGLTDHGPRRDVWTTIDRLSDVLRSDPIWQDCGVVFDRIQGSPTLWTKDKIGRHQVEKRGTTVKLPTCPNSVIDLAKLEAMIPVSIDRLNDRLGVVIPKTASRGSGISPVIDADLSVMDGFSKKKALISRLLISNDGDVTEDQVYAEYMAQCEPTGDTPRDQKERRRVIRTMLGNMKRKFRPKSDRRLYPFSQGQFTHAIKALNVPASAYQWSRREKLNEARLSDFVSMMVANSFYKAGAFSQTCRDTTVANSRLLKGKGAIDWTINNSTYRKYLDIAIEYRLLSVEEEFVRPTIDPLSGRKLVKGRARLIAPGAALGSVRDEWLPLWNVYRASRQQAVSRAA